MPEQVKEQNNGRKGEKKRSINPYAAKVLSLRRVVFEVVTPERLRHLLDVVLRMAEQGHLPAIRLLLSYVVGRLDRPIDIDWDEIPEQQPAPAPAPAAAPAPKAPEPPAPKQSEEARQQQQKRRLEQLRALDTATLAAGPKDDRLVSLIAGALRLPEVAGGLVSPRP